MSIGFLTLALYCTGRQPGDIHPVLLTVLVPIAATDAVRHRWPSVNRVYIGALGALMRESEVDGWNGVIAYLLGAWIVLRAAPKDVAVVSVLLLSWCDTAASTFGRLWGHLTPRVRRGKSIAGSLAAAATGCLSALLFYGWLAPRFARYDEAPNAFAFQGLLTLPPALHSLLPASGADARLGRPRPQCREPLGRPRRQCQ